jgi:molybdenum-dependent DNA-binding transcriptional regulator ModE
VLAGVAGVDAVNHNGDGLIVELRQGRRSDLVAALTAAGLRVEAIMQTQRLEDAFLDLLEGRQLAVQAGTP